MYDVEMLCIIMLFVSLFFQLSFGVGDSDGTLLVFLDDGTTPGSELIHFRPSGVDAYFIFLFSTADPCSELLFGRLGQLLSFFSQWRPYVLSCFLGRLGGPPHSSYQHCLML